MIRSFQHLGLFVVYLCCSLFMNPAIVIRHRIFVFIVIASCSHWNMAFLLASAGKTGFCRQSSASSMLNGKYHQVFFQTKLSLTTNIFIVGKRSGGETWIAEGCQEYEKRLSSGMVINTSFLKSNDELIKASKQLKGIVFALDEHGKSLTSPEFSSLLYGGYQDGGSVVSFIIGGYDGLPDEIKRRHNLLSLSKMTWTHQMARLLLLEQIYRASEIKKGSAYHKE